MFIGHMSEGLGSYCDISKELSGIGLAIEFICWFDKYYKIFEI